jgi:hypothetical protein
MQVGDHVYLATGPSGGFAQDKARDARNKAKSEAVTVLSETSTCSQWKSSPTPEQMAFVNKFLTGQGQAAEPAKVIGIGGWIAGKCAEGSQSQIGALAAESPGK